MNLQELKDYIPNRDTYALVGSKVSHSVSPILHKKLFEFSQTCADYILVDINPEEIEEFCTIAEQKLKGFNVTMPFKKTIIPYLKNSNDLSSVNTVITSDMSGYNTDLLGFIETLEFNRVDVQNKNVLILGNGGISDIMAKHCVSKKAKVTIAVRDLKALTNPLYGVKYIEYWSIKECDILLNGTPVGMYPSEHICPILHIPDSCTFLFDSIYNPPKTKLIKKALYKKIPISNGLLMLIMQAAHSQKLWTDHDFDKVKTKELKRDIIAHLAVKRLEKNIVLCGFMGSGKTSVGKLLQKITGLELYDSDKIIEARTEMTIKEYFDIHGEKEFRKLEHEVIAELCKLKNVIISTGGGVLTYDPNINILKQTSTLFHLNTPLTEILANTKDTSRRPLLSDDPKKVEKLYNERYYIYREVCDFSLYGYHIHDICYNILENI